MDTDTPTQSLEEQLRFPKVGDLIEWVNLLEVWANDKWVDEGGPYFGIHEWNADMIKIGIVIEESVVEDVFHWTVWSWHHSSCFHISSTTDKIRILSRTQDEFDTILQFYIGKINKIIFCFLFYNTLI